MTNKQFWLWVLVNGFAAVLLAITPLFFHSETEKLAAILPFGIDASFVQIGGLILTPLLSILLPGLVLRQLTPGVPLLVWLFGTFAYAVIFVVLSYFRIDVGTGWGDFGSKFFELTHRYDRDWWDVFNLPWHRAALTYFVLPFLCWIPLVVTLKLWQGQKRFAIYVGFAMATGTFGQYLSTLFLENILQLPGRTSLGGRSIEELSMRDSAYFVKHFIVGGFGSLVAVSVLLPALEMPTSASRLRLKAFAVVLATCFCIPLYDYVTSHRGFSAGFPDVKKRFASTPQADIGTGVPILKFLSETKFPTPHYPNAPTYNFAKFDTLNRHFITLDENRALVIINPINGEILQKIADPVFDGKDFSLAWTRDGKFLLLRSGVKMDDDPFTLEGRKQSRIRVYAAPDYTLVSDRMAPMPCGVTGPLEQPIELQSEHTFILGCVRYGVVMPDSPDVPELIKVPIEKNNPIVTVKFYDARSTGRRMKLLETHDDAFIVRQENPTKTSTTIWLESLNKISAPRELKNLMSRDVAGGMTFQEMTFSNGFFHVRFCGYAHDISNPPADAVPNQVHSVCRTLSYDPKSLDLVKKQDEQPRKDLEQGVGQSIYRADSFSFKTRWQDTNRTGQIEVFNTTTEELLQTITTKSQSIVTASNDGTLLITHAFNERRLIIYSIDETFKSPFSSSN